MKVLLDVGISPRLRMPLQEAFDGGSVESAIFHHWRTLQNSELLEHQHGFTALVTADKRLATEHPRPPLAVIAVDDNRLSALRGAVHDIADAIRETPLGAHRLVRVAS